MFDISKVVGQSFGSLTVVSLSTKVVKGHHCLDTICTCGNIHTTTWNNLQRGMTTKCTSCARSKPLLYQEFPVKLFKSEYRSYRAMLNRCFDTKHTSYDRYGALGITVETPDWLGDLGFEQFMRDMGRRPDGCTLDRIDNSKGYSRENCRWAKTGVQNHNKSKRRDAVTSEFIGVSLQKGSWWLQITFEDQKIRKMYHSEYDAAVAYDNYSELWYGDRPNGTSKYEPEEKFRKRGGVTQDKRSGNWRVRFTTKEKKRIDLGSYKTYEEAVKVLDEYKQTCS